MHPFDPAIRLVQATNYTWVAPRAPRRVTLVPLHSMESSNKPWTAEGVAAWFAKPNPQPGLPRDPARHCPAASAHVCFDQDSGVACVLPQHIAWACSSSNWPSYNVELAGWAKLTEAQWLAPPNDRMFKIAAMHIARACRYFGIPPTFLEDDELGLVLRDSVIRQGKIAGAESGSPGGLTTHAACNRVWKKWDLYGLPKPKPGVDLSHSDPGVHFPLEHFAALVAEAQAMSAPTPAAGTPSPLIA